MPRLGIRLGIALAVLAAFVYASTFTGFFDPLPTTPMNVVLVSIDTLRADRLGAYGYARNTSPHIDALASDAVVFEHTIATSPWTLPSHASMFTGMYPSSHGAILPEGHAISSQVRTLPEILQEKGYHTVGFAGGGYVGSRFGFARGFDLYVDTNNAWGEAKLLSNAVKRLDRVLAELPADKPFFAFLHSFDVHCPYTPPEPYFSRFTSREAVEIDPAGCGSSYYNARGITPAQALYLSDRYDGAIAWVDGAIGELVSMLKERELYERTVIFLTSDHGEEFLEHGRIGHQLSLYSELLRVPLVVRLPGGRSAERVRNAVSLIDIAPTILELAGIPPPPDMQGVSLRRLLRSSPWRFPFRAFQIAELDWGLHLRSRWDGSTHLIIGEDRSGPDVRPLKPQLFDLRADPGERNDIADDDEARTEALAAELRAFLATLHESERTDAGELSPEETERLRALGYF